MRLLVQALSAVRGRDRGPATRLTVQPLNFGCDVVETLRSKEIPIRWPANSLLDHKALMQLRMRRPRAKTEVSASSFRIEPHFYGNRFDQRRFSDPVFPNEKGHGRMKFQSFKVAHCGN